MSAPTSGALFLDGEKEAPMWRRHVWALAGLVALGGARLASGDEEDTRRTSAMRSEPRAHERATASERTGDRANDRAAVGKPEQGVRLVREPKSPVPLPVRRDRPTKPGDHRPPEPPPPTRAASASPGDRASPLTVGGERSPVPSPFVPRKQVKRPGNPNPPEPPAPDRSPSDGK